MLEKAARELEKNDREAVLAKYQEAVGYFRDSMDEEHSKQCIDKIAPLYRGIAKDTEDPVKVFNVYRQSADVYTQIETGIRSGEGDE